MSDADDDDLDDDSLMMDDRTDPNRVGPCRESLPSQVLVHKGTRLCGKNL
jgi:hypothetical protein